MPIILDGILKIYQQIVLYVGYLNTFGTSNFQVIPVKRM